MNDLGNPDRTFRPVEYATLEAIDGEGRLLLTLSFQEESGEVIGIPLSSTDAYNLVQLITKWAREHSNPDDA